MANILQEKREKMLEFLNKLKKEHKDDESLRALGEIERALNEKKYGLVWEEHKEEIEEKLKENVLVFKEIEERKIKNTKENEYNFLLEGDNLHSLKILEKTHKGKIDVIYIDPPYNTGNKDFIYNDEYIDKTDGYSHSKWLSFMSKRLKIAKNLLSDSGVIFISIDENENAQLKLLCNEIFGENNVDDIIWQKMDSKVDKNTNSKIIKRFKSIHETIIVCYKNKQIKIFNKMMKKPDWKNKQSNPDKDPRGAWSSGIISYEEGHKNEDRSSNNYYEIITPSGKKITRHWFVTKEEFNFLVKDNRISFPKKGEGIPRLKTFENEEKEYYMDSILRGVGTSSIAKDEIYNILGDREKFDTPKPLKLIIELIRVSSNIESYILDFFAGSGTTGHAVMKLNAEDGGNRKYILCTNNENNICEEVTYKRLLNIQSELPHNLKYFKTDFISKYSAYEDDEMISEKMLMHIKEMIELEHHVEIDNEKYIIVEDEDELDEILEKIKENGKIFITSDIFLSRNHQRILEDKNVSIINIPEYYYRNELKEVGEL